MAMTRSDLSKSYNIFLSSTTQHRLDWTQVQKAVGLKHDGRHCVEFLLDGHGPERTQWVEDFYDGAGMVVQPKNFQNSKCLDTCIFIYRYYPCLFNLCLATAGITETSRNIYKYIYIYVYPDLPNPNKKSNNGGLNWKTLKPQIQCLLFNFPQPRCCDRGCIVMQFTPHEVNIHRTGCLKTIVWVSLKIQIIIIYIHITYDCMYR